MNKAAAACMHGAKAMWPGVWSKPATALSGKFQLANVQQMEAEGQETLLKDWMLINHHHSICQPRQYP